MSPRRSAAQRNKRAKAERWSASADDLDRPFDDAELERWWQETGRDELRELLLWRWDPMGVSDWFPEAANEYHDFGRPIVALLVERGDVDGLAQHLHEISRTWIGMPDAPVPTPASTRAAADIAAWFERSRRRWREFGTPYRPD